MEVAVFEYALVFLLLAMIAVAIGFPVGAAAAGVASAACLAMKP